MKGIAQHSETGEIWFTEHGPIKGEEINILKNGGNYGWPDMTYELDYDGSVVSNQSEKDGMLQPVIFWNPSIAVCPAEFCDNPLFPKWKNNLFMGALPFEEVRRLPIDGLKVEEQEMILIGYGRVRILNFGSYGALYVVLNQPDKIVRITPQ